MGVCLFFKVDAIVLHLFGVTLLELLIESLLRQHVVAVIIRTFEISLIQHFLVTWLRQIISLLNWLLGIGRLSLLVLDELPNSFLKFSR